MRTEDKSAAGPPVMPLEVLLGLGGLGSVCVRYAPRGLDVAVSDVCVYDPIAPGPIRKAALVVGIGVHARSLDAHQLIQAAADQGAAAVLVRASDAEVDDLVDAADRAGLALLTIDGDLPWADILVALHGALASCMSEDPYEPYAPGAGDLFELANAVAALVGGAVIIEDVHGSVLSYSTTDEPIDEARLASILARHTPEVWRRRLTEAGVYRSLWRGEVVRYAPDPAEASPRLAVAVRTPDEVLGVIWVIEGQVPFGETAQAALRRSGEAASAHLLRHHAAADLTRARWGEHLGAILGGRPESHWLADELGIDERHGALVVAISLDAEADDARRAAQRRAVGIAALHYQALRARSASVVIGDVLYVLIPDEPPLLPSTVRRATEDLVARLHSVLRLPTRAAIGFRASQLDGISWARESADLALRVGVGEPARVVVDATRVSNDLLLLRLADAAAERPELMGGKLAVLAQHDERRATAYIPTLRAYLECFGDIGAAADGLGVHPNTMRYRLQRLRQIAGVDLDDPDERLVLALELRTSRAAPALVPDEALLLKGAVRLHQDRA